MISDFIKNTIKKYFIHKPTASQNTVIEEFVNFLITSEKKPIFLLKGYAGTGKTSLVSAFVQVLQEMKFKIKLTAPTGRAAKVFSGYSGVTASTIHKIIYRQQSSNDGFGNFNINKNFNNGCIFFIDEASMISGYSFDNNNFGTGNLLEDLMTYIFEAKDNRLVIIGDDAQLPPVGTSDSPALKKDVLESFDTSVTEVFMTDVIRQSLDSGILNCASALQKEIENNIYFGSLPKLKINGFNDVVKIQGEELIDTLSEAIDRYGIENTIIINRSNKRTNLYNKGVRGSILYREEEISQGDIVLVMKNNYFWLKDNKEVNFIANGDIAEIVRVKNHEELYGYRFVNCTIRLIDYKQMEVDVKLMLDALSSDTAGLNIEQQKEFYYEVLKDYEDIPTKAKKHDAVRNNEYYNALQVKFAYAMTCHKTQGGQWKCVFIDPGFVPAENINRDYYRWLYTAITRCTEKLYLINFQDEYFE